MAAIAQNKEDYIFEESIPVITKDQQRDYTLKSTIWWFSYQHLGICGRINLEGKFIVTNRRPGHSDL
ncbi:hypothetical protein E2562_008131 [Oryza meyeriana var. granulata]|uniref:Uncharacterized protein n=1 Tax=Oryza meyeriana var. granulata TaxID=110450 RepID=A0A6G1CFL3_9ORYZ|nr:hypothetical protein E2562_008131 [Oryza meyeriana var. granulata]